MKLQDGVDQFAWPISKHICDWKSKFVTQTVTFGVGFRGCCPPAIDGDADDAAGKRNTRQALIEFENFGEWRNSEVVDSGDLVAPDFVAEDQAMRMAAVKQG